jgi:1-acyl-sn-glycerol-3-phosphate acyltransferase
MILSLLSYPRSILMAAIYPIFLGVMSLVAVMVNLIFNRRSFDDTVVRAWGRWSCWMFGVKVRTFGIENVPPGGCVLLFNHTSFFDIFAMASAIPGLRFGAKIELFRIPIFGVAMKRLGILPIDRMKREKVFAVYRDARERIQRGERIALAPEGTRQVEEKLGSFKAGPFVFAISASAPVVPVVIRQASLILPKERLFPNWGTWSRDISLHILPAIETTGYHVDERPRLQERVRQEMALFFNA